MIDFGALPPEINSARIYAGPGSGSLAAAAAAWSALAANRGSAAVAFSAVTEALSAGPWMGPSSAAQALAAAPFVAWMLATTTQNVEAGALAMQAAAAFETARATSVSPPEVAANRTELATLVATNFLGVNSAAIAAVEADYSRMWAQDAGAMYTFAGQAAQIAGMMVPYIPPDPTTDPAGMAAQAAAVGQSAGQSAGQAASQASGAGQMAMPAAASSLLSAGPQAMSGFQGIFKGLSSPLSSMGQMANPASSLGQFQGLLTPLTGGFSQFTNGLGTLMPGIANSVSSMSGYSPMNLPMSYGNFAATASMGQSASLPRGLSVPQGWVTATENTERTVMVRAAEPTAATWTVPTGQVAAVPGMNTGMVGPGAPAPGSSVPANWSPFLGGRQGNGERPNTVLPAVQTTPGKPMFN